MLFLALSCLQGRPALQAAEELCALGDVGIQLTPGCAPYAGLETHLQRQGIDVRTHHGYSERALTRRVWMNSGRCAVPHHSVHAPTVKQTQFPEWRANWWLPFRGARAIEVMYGEYVLGDSASLRWAMDHELSLAVDISHLAIQRHTGTLDDVTYRDVLSYENVAEIHVSTSRGDRDVHAPLTADTPGLAWAIERSQRIPLVLECYMHKLTTDERLAQLALLGAP